ncbi:MAG TPA: DUF1080 domain-containing protein [Candidatus Acidoferrum sp.]|nr:DUF1080 domain-containing protein [Candidatus Acidoferrum sp.]
MRINLRVCLGLVPAVFLSVTGFAQAPIPWKIHDLDRPLPPIVDPGTPSTQETPGQPPSDAVVLFDGKDLSDWQNGDKSPAKWKVENGYMEVVAKTGSIQTKKAFGDCQLHVEFMEPLPAVGESQERGNSGVFLMNQYEIQVLDSYENKTYADGQAAAVYGQYPPLVNASRPPGIWQVYTIVFHGPRFDSAGKLLKPARVTVFHNGVLVQDNVELTGPTAHGSRPPYKAGPDKGPVGLQDHGRPVRFRNIWIRELAEDSR